MVIDDRSGLLQPPIQSLVLALDAVLLIVLLSGALGERVSALANRSIQ